MLAVKEERHSSDCTSSGESSDVFLPYDYPPKINSGSSGESSDVFIPFTFNTVITPKLIKHKDRKQMTTENPYKRKSDVELDSSSRNNKM